MKNSKDAKMSVLKKLKKEMLEEMGESSGEDLKEKMMVKIAGDSPEAIKEGLSKAEQILKMRGEMMGDIEEDEPMIADAEEAAEEYEEDVDEDIEDEEELSKEDLEKKIAILQSKLESMA
jgi:hypothetical protein